MQEYTNYLKIKLKYLKSLNLEVKYYPKYPMEITGFIDITNLSNHRLETVDLLAGISNTDDCMEGQRIIVESYIRNLLNEKEMSKEELFNFIRIAQK